jgi:hypothetical protein
MNAYDITDHKNTFGGSEIGSCADIDGHDNAYRYLSQIMRMPLKCT